MLDDPEEVIVVLEDHQAIPDEASPPERVRLPKGVYYSDLWKDKGEQRGLRHRFRVADPQSKKMESQTFSDYDRGLTWAKDRRSQFLKGKATARTLSWKEIGKKHLELLAAIPCTANHLRQAKQVVDGIYAAGGRDVDDESFSDTVQRWLLTYQSCRGLRRGKHSNEKTVKWRPASASLKHKFWGIAKTIVQDQVVNRGYMGHNPLLQIRLPKVSKLLRDIFTVAQLKRLVDCRMEADAWYLFTCLAIYTGQRSSVVRRMELSWFDWHAGYITIPADAAGNQKSCRGYRTPIQPELALILQLAFARYGKPKGPLVGLNPEARHIPDCQGNNVTNGFKAYCRRAGVVTGLGPHACRHTLAAILTAMGLSPYLVMDYIGHATADVTKHYASNAEQVRQDVKTWTDGKLQLRPKAVMQPIACEFPELPPCPPALQSRHESRASA